MKKIPCLFIALSLLTQVGNATPPAKEATEEIAVSFMEVTEAYRALKADYPEIAAIVRSIEIDKNAMTIQQGHPKLAEFKKSLAELDRRPNQILLEAVVSEVSQSTGKERDLSRPTVLTLEGQPAAISLPSSSDDQELKVTITSRSVPSIARK